MLTQNLAVHEEVIRARDNGQVPVLERDVGVSHRSRRSSLDDRVPVGAELGIDAHCERVREDEETRFGGSVSLVEALQFFMFAADILWSKTCSPIQWIRLGSQYQKRWWYVDGQDNQR